MKVSNLLKNIVTAIQNIKIAITNIENCRQELISTASTKTISLQNAYAYLLTIYQVNGADETNNGIYFVNAHNTTGTVRTIAASSVATVSINKITLTIVTSNKNVRILLIPLRGY